MSIFNSIKKSFKESADRPYTRSEKTLSVVAFGAVVVAWMAGALAWYWCLLPGLLVFGAFAPTTPKPGTPNQDLPAVPTSPGAASDLVDTSGVYRFKYQKDSGEVSRRRIQLRGGSSIHGSKYLTGICLTAKSMRTFRLDRIITNLTAEDTGELLTPEDVFAACKAAGKVKAEADFLNVSARPSSTAPSKVRAPRSSREWVTAVYFAGFRGNKYTELENIALAAGWQVRMNISPTVNYLVRNGQAGVRQLSQAEEMGVSVIDEDTFRALSV